MNLKAKVEQVTRGEIGSVVKQIDALRDDLKNRFDARDEAATKLIPALVASMDRLQGEYQWADFDEDTAKVKDVRRRRKDLDKQIKSR